jgi:glycosyltransferase involved in cell wall biosynthesis
MTKIDKKICTDMFKQILKEARSGPNPKFHLIHGMMTDDDVAGLYRHPKIKGLVTLTRGEGFGLPILEAAASGLPVIATNWSGHMDFMQLGKFVNVDYELKEIDASRVDNKIFMKGSRWAEVIEDDFKRRIKKFRESSSVPREWASELQKKVHQSFSFEAVARKWEELLGDKLV